VCPAHWYTSCPSGYSDVGSEGCGFLGCRIKCKCSQVCGCYDSNNNQDHAKCQRGGDTSATCNDGGSTTTSYTCQCSTGFYDHNGNCVDYNACEGGQRSCRDGGDSSATCVDLSAPSTGFACACSAGFHDDGGVCTSNKCTSLALLDGMIGSGGDNKCVNGLVLDAVYDTNCEYTCVPGFTGISTGGSAKFSCGINGGTATTSYQCTENQCHTLQLGMNVEGSSNGAISACTESQQLSSVTYPSCGITCSDGYFDNAATKTKVSCLTTGGATVPTIIASVEESTCNDNELENTVDGDALTYVLTHSLTHSLSLSLYTHTYSLTHSLTRFTLTHTINKHRYWRPTTCLGNTKIMYSTGIHFQLTYVRLDSIFDGLNGVTKFNVHACDTSSIESATCVLQKECTISATNSNCDVSDSFNVPTRFVMIEITETESSSSTPYIIGVELFESFSCQSWSNCEPGTYVAVQPTNQNDRVCISCPSGYTSVGLNAVSCVEEDGCVNPDACGEHGTCVDNQPPHDGYSCSCETGYHEQSGICVDVNSCSSHTCGYAGDINAMCVDHVAPEVGFTCVCSSGYVESGAVCVNENGCDSNPCQSEGDENAVCHDTPAPGVGNTCSCSDMFVYEASMDVTTGMTVCTCIDSQLL